MRPGLSGEWTESISRIRGYDAAHRLTYGKKTRAWGTGQSPEVTEDKIVKTITGEHGLTAAVNMSGLSGVAYEYVMQYNQSDWDFLWARAAPAGLPDLRRGL